MILSKPKWDLDGSVGQELCIRFDMQLLTLTRVLEHLGHTFDLSMFFLATTSRLLTAVQITSSSSLPTTLNTPSVQWLLPQSLCQQ
jgi:hypothetical protein